jgi:hypothetical protein
MIINLDQVYAVEYRPQEGIIRFHYVNNNTFSIGLVGQAEFERIASALKYGKVKA